MIEMFERADREPDPSLRKPILTFVIAGGGFAGVELAGALNDFARGILADYPNLRPEELSVIRGALAGSHPAGAERIARPLCPRKEWRTEASPFA